jgi:hypothetical protein
MPVRACVRIDDTMRDSPSASRDPLARCHRLPPWVAALQSLWRRRRGRPERHSRSALSSSPSCSSHPRSRVHRPHPLNNPRLCLAAARLPPPPAAAAAMMLRRAKPPRSLSVPRDGMDPGASPSALPQRATQLTARHRGQHYLGGRRPHRSPVKLVSEICMRARARACVRAACSAVLQDMS